MHKAELWTVERRCGKCCKTPDDDCDAAGHPFYDQIILHPEAWEEVREFNSRTEAWKLHEALCEKAEADPEHEWTA